MEKIVHVRLDKEAALALRKLVARLGGTESSILRMALAYLDNSQVKKNKRQVIGVGKFASGIKDLASNKKHLSGFGK